MCMLLSLSFKQAQPLANDQYSDMIRIDPIDLLPRDPMIENEKVQIKKIDTVLALELPNDRVNNALAKWPKAHRSFMQSTMNPHCRSPIVVNIEVKKAAGIDPLGQLGVWSAAGFQKRLIDGDEKEKIPRISMPGLATVRNRWERHIAYIHPDGRVVKLPSFITLSPFSHLLHLFVYLISKLIPCLFRFSQVLWKSAARDPFLGSFKLYTASRFSRTGH